MRWVERLIGESVLLILTLAEEGRVLEHILPTLNDSRH